MNKLFAITIKLPWEDNSRTVQTTEDLLAILKPYTPYSTFNSPPEITAFFEGGLSKEIEVKSLCVEKIVSKEDVDIILIKAEKMIDYGKKRLLSGPGLSGEVLYTDRDRAKLIIDLINNSGYAWVDRLEFTYE
jgi:hypothetical protein